MKLLNVSSNFSYRIGFFTLKFFGFAFFTIKRSLNAIEFQKNLLDYVLFSVSIMFSLILPVIESKLNSKLEIKSTILNVATNVLFKISMISIIVTKLINMTSAKKAFEILKNYERIDKKVNFK